MLRAQADVELLCHARQSAVLVEALGCLKVYIHSLLVSRFVPTYSADNFNLFSPDIYI